MLELESNSNVRFSLYIDCLMSVRTSVFGFGAKFPTITFGVYRERHNEAIGNPLRKKSLHCKERDNGWKNTESAADSEPSAALYCIDNNNDDMSEDTTPRNPTNGDAGAEEEQPAMKPLFDALKENDNAVLSFAGEFRDKVRVLFEHFDVDGDGRLRYDELAALQIATNDSKDGECTSWPARASTAIPTKA